MKERKRKRIKNLICIATVCGIIFLWIFLKFRTKEYVGTSFEDYKASAGVVVMEVPSTATDFKYYMSRSFVTNVDMYAFTLDEAAYDKFVADCITKYHINPDNTAADYTSQWYGMKVSDIDQQSPTYTLDDFPSEFKFERIIDDNINDYVVILYSPVGSGVSGEGILYNSNTGKIVCYREGHLR